MAPIWSQHPFKALLTTLVLLSSPIYTVALSILYLPRAFRPDPHWNFRTALGNKILRIFYEHATRVRLEPKYYLKPGNLKERFILVRPGPADIYTGILEHPTIKPAAVGAIWFPKCPASTECNNTKVVLHFQGGAFVTATDPKLTGRFPSTLFESKMGAVTFYAQYRVSRTEDTRFPAGLQDLVTFYRYILDQGFDPKNIIISGDSAGGNLVIALLRYIEASNGILPNPHGAMAWSPWVDVGLSAVEGYKKSSCNRTDFVPPGLLRWGVAAYRSSGSSKNDVEPYISPAHHAFSTQTPLFIHAGTVEILYEEINGFAEAMTAVSGNRVRYFETPHAPHDLILVGKFFGLQMEAEDAVESAHEFFGS
jgi:acetyl esterase/lipase